MIGGELNSVLSENEFAFVKTYNALTTLKLKPLEYLILNEILSFHVQGMEYTGSFNYFCRKYNTAHTTVLRALKSLTDKGYIIKKTSKGGDKTSIYRINEEKLIPVFLNTKETLGLNNANSPETRLLDNANSAEIAGLNTANSAEIAGLDNATVQKLQGKHCKKCRDNPAKTAHNKNIYKNNNKNKYIDHQSRIDDACDFSSLDTETGLQETEYPSSYQKDHEQKDNPKTEGKDQASAMTEKEKEKLRQKKEKKEAAKKELEEQERKFNEFWEIYPRKVAKKKAHDIWFKKIKPNDELFEKIMAALRAQSDEWKRKQTELEHIPHPTTWLNGERWNDEIITDQNKKAADESQQPCTGKSDAAKIKNVLQTRGDKNIILNNIIKALVFHWQGRILEKRRDLNHDWR